VSQRRVWVVCRGPTFKDLVGSSLVSIDGHRSEEDVLRRPAVVLQDCEGNLVQGAALAARGVDCMARAVRDEIKTQLNHGKR
jgi:hypothetical protein